MLSGSQYSLKLLSGSFSKIFCEGRDMKTASHRRRGEGVTDSVIFVQFLSIIASYKCFGSDWQNGICSRALKKTYFVIFEDLG